MNNKSFVKWLWLPILLCVTLWTPRTVLAARYVTQASFAQTLGIETAATGLLTRGDMARMLVAALGMDELALQLDVYGAPFIDIKAHFGYITLVTDVGLMTEARTNRFNPNAYVTAAQAAEAVARLDALTTGEPDFVGAYYAIKSAAQMALMDGLDAVFFGWSRLTVDGSRIALNTTNTGGNEYRVPAGYQEVRDKAADKTALLMVTIDPSLSAAAINTASKRTRAANLIAAAAKALQTAQGTLVFDGVVIDFENLRGETERANFNAFLTVLRTALDKDEKLLYVAVQPVRKPGQAYFDGYDYKTIGQLADKVILMAHDYAAKVLNETEMASGFTVTPLTPYDEVYAALKAITDAETGVADRSKIILQFSIDAAQWKTVDDVVVNAKPYSPTYDLLLARMTGGAALFYSTRYQSPYMTFYAESDGTTNIIWYEDERSIAAKMTLARLFGVTGVSFWRLGTIPGYASPDDTPLYLDIAQWITNRVSP